MVWAVAGAILASIAALVYWLFRRRRHRPRLISFVALVRKPVSFDPAVLANLARKVWNADLGDGESAGADGFVAGAGVINTIVHQGAICVVNSFPEPYADVEKTAEVMADMRIRALFRQHKAWYSCDAMGPDGTTPEADVRDWYRRLGPLFAELLDENCLLIFLPDSEMAYSINDDTETALRSDDPVSALAETMTVPFIEVADDDPLMKQAVEAARRDWPRFVAAYEAKAGANFGVKAPVTHAANTEFIWIQVTAIEGDRVYGELGNDPANLGSLKLGSKVSVPVAELNDWRYIDPQGNLAGGFTVEAVQKAARRARPPKSADGDLPDSPSSGLDETGSRADEGV
jgi:uncharacterized protein YegJ (DUF2314 family)